jgi:hypothetical protein
MIPHWLTKCVIVQGYIQVLYVSILKLISFLTSAQGWEKKNPIDLLYVN